MKYSFIPRLDLEGSVNGERVQGASWMDHQWGDSGWFLKGNKKKIVLGWDCLLMNLNDGSDLLLFVHKDAHTGEILSTYACRMAGGRSGGRSDPQKAGSG